MQPITTRILTLLAATLLTACHSTEQLPPQQFDGLTLDLSHTPPDTLTLTVTNNAPHPITIGHPDSIPGTLHVSQGNQTLSLHRGSHSTVKAITSPFFITMPPGRILPLKINPTKYAGWHDLDPTQPREVWITLPNNFGPGGVSSNHLTLQLHP
jgi:hypothetical protein